MECSRVAWLFLALVLPALANADPFSHRFPQQFHLVKRRGTRQKACCRTDAMRARLDRQLSGQDDFLTREQPGFHDDLHRALIRHLDEVAQLAENISPVAVLEPARVQHHVEFLRAAVDGGLGFVAFHVGVHRAEWEPDKAGHFHAAVFKEVTSLRHA